MTELLLPCSFYVKNDKLEEKNKQNVSYFGNKFLSLHSHKQLRMSDTFKLAFLVEAQTFINSLPQPAADKIYHNIYRVQQGERNPELFKKLENTNIWEFRTLFNKTAYRLFAFWDTEAETLVIATHGIVKKTQKTPKKEIKKAERIRKDYINSKKQ